MEDREADEHQRQVLFRAAAYALSEGQDQERNRHHPETEHLQWHAADAINQQDCGKEAERQEDVEHRRSRRRRDVVGQEVVVGAFDGDRGQQRWREDADAVSRDVHKEPRNGGEDRAADHVLLKEGRLEQRLNSFARINRLLAILLCDLDLCFRQRFGYCDRLLLAAILSKPAWALWRLAADEDDHQSRDRAEAEHQPPSDVDLGVGCVGADFIGDDQQDHEPDDCRQQNAHGLQAEGADEPAAASLLRQDFSEVAGGDWVVEADRDADHEAEEDQ